MEYSEVRIRVRYAETDQMGVVYHSNYLVWMEMGRVELCRARGVRYRDMEQDDGILLAVAEANCRFQFPARYDDEVVVRTSVARASTRLLTFQYEIREVESQRMLATGFTKHIFCDRELKPCRLPAKYHAAFFVTAAPGRFD